MAEAKIAKTIKPKAKKEPTYSVVMKKRGPEYSSVVVPTGGTEILWRSRSYTDSAWASASAKGMAKSLGAKFIDQT